MAKRQPISGSARKAAKRVPVGDVGDPGGRGGGPGAVPNIRGRMGSPQGKNGTNITGGGTGFAATKATNPPGQATNPPGSTNPDDQTLFMQVLGAVLSQYGLNTPGMMAYLKQLNLDEKISDQPSEAELLPWMYDQPDFRARFPSIAAQADAQKAGKTGRVWSPGEVLQYEDVMRNMLTSYGINGYDTQDITSKLILGNVSAEEASTRVQLAAYAATTGPKEVAEALLAHEGMSYGDLIGFYLDPNRGQQEIQRKHSVAQMQAWQKQSGLTQDWGFSERVVAQGISNEQAQSAFIRAAMRRNATAGYGETVTQQQTKTAELGMSASDQRSLTRVASSRQGLFSKGGGAAEDKSGVSGLRKQ